MIRRGFDGHRALVGETPVYGDDRDGCGSGLECGDVTALVDLVDRRVGGRPTDGLVGRIGGRNGGRETDAVPFGQGAGVPVEDYSGDGDGTRDGNEDRDHAGGGMTAVDGGNRDGGGSGLECGDGSVLIHGGHRRVGRGP